MGEIRVSMTELRQDLCDLVNRAAYRGEQIILVSHGQAKAAIIGVDDLTRLQSLGRQITGWEDNYREALARADQVGEQICRWRQAQGIQPGDSTELLRELREERDDEILGLR
jgi:prevent-host-death family protein